MKLLVIRKADMCILFVFYDKPPYKSFTFYPRPFPEFRAEEHKVKLSRHEDIWGSGYILVAPPFLTLALDGGEWSASCPGRFTLGKESQYPLDRRLDGPQSVWTLWRREKSRTAAGKGTPAVQPIARRWAIPVPSAKERRSVKTMCIWYYVHSEFRLNRPDC
jgi:hypothetical protein